MSAAHRAGYVAIIGRPSVGKSTLLNRLLGTKLSIVSPRPQTTRHKLLGLMNAEGYQAVFVDTPGWLDIPKDALQKSLLDASSSTAKEEADILLWIADAAPAEADLALLAVLKKRGKPMVLALNKADRPDAAKRLDAAEAAYRAAAPWESVFRISALQGHGVNPLRDFLLSKLPEGEAFYPKDQLSDRYERFFAAELIREQVFAQFGDEIPHACAVQIELYRETPGRPDEIHALLIVERDGQKAIVIGERGRALGRLRQAALAEIEKFLGRPATLELFVKVKKDWRKDPKALREFGY